MRVNKDYVAGAIAITSGILATYKSFNYEVGTLTQMGPGFFPLIVGGLLIFCGGLIVLGGIARGNVTVIDGKGDWRGRGLVVLSLISFIVLGKHTGLLPASFALTFISAMADRDNTVKEALVLAVAVCIVAVVVFWWAFDIQFPLLIWNW